MPGDRSSWIIFKWMAFLLFLAAILISSFFDLGPLNGLLTIYVFMFINVMIHLWLCPPLRTNRPRQKDSDDEVLEDEDSDGRFIYHDPVDDSSLCSSASASGAEPAFSDLYRNRNRFRRPRPSSNHRSISWPGISLRNRTGATRRATTEAPRAVNRLSSPPMGRTTVGTQTSTAFTSPSSAITTQTFEADDGGAEATREPSARQRTPRPRQCRPRAPMPEEETRGAMAACAELTREAATRQRTPRPRQCRARTPMPRKVAAAASAEEPRGATAACGSRTNSHHHAGQRTPSVLHQFHRQFDQHQRRTARQRRNTRSARSARTRFFTQQLLPTSSTSSTGSGSPRRPPIRPGRTARHQARSALPVRNGALPVINGRSGRSGRPARRDRSASLFRPVGLTPANSTSSLSSSSSSFSAAHPVAGATAARPAHMDDSAQVSPLTLYSEPPTEASSARSPGRNETAHPARLDNPPPQESLTDVSSPSSADTDDSVRDGDVATPRKNQ